MTTRAKTSLIKKIFGSRNARLIKTYQKLIVQINSLEAEVEILSDQQLADQTKSLRQEYQEGATLESLLVESFAVVREVSKRVLNMRHFDVQLLGGIALFEGKIAEMRTGEGKTLVATLPCYLYAISNKTSHVVTVNDYLAKRDSKWMGKVFEFLGLKVGTIFSDMDPLKRKDAYQSDIVYGANNEFGFDYLRDNMAFVPEDQVMGELNFALIDEVDSILIDEARTPLIISGPTQEDAEIYQVTNRLIANLTPAKLLDSQTGEVSEGDYLVDEKDKQVSLTEQGYQNAEKLLNDYGLLKENTSVYDASNIGLMHYVNAALRAKSLFKKDVDYLVKDNQVMIVDEFTGRVMTGRRWSDGLHQAIEAKEKVSIKEENQTLASITYQNYFRLYPNLSGMTGTADTEAAEFSEIYNMEVMLIPPNKPLTRKDYADSIYMSMAEKFEAIGNEIKRVNETHQPMLVGTSSIENSEKVSNLLNKLKLNHQVLNAKFHKQEAGIIANAGAKDSITIATNMAGRGTDIVLGGSLDNKLIELNNKFEAGTITEDKKTKEAEQITKDWEKKHNEVVSLGGLYILGTERHESRRIDNQLRGRAARQGDPGSSRFYISLEDDLMRIFASEKLGSMMKKLGMKRGEAIEHPWINKAIENAQKKVEGHNFDIRKNILDYDNVINEQRKIIYEQRNRLMRKKDLSKSIQSLRVDVILDLVDSHIPAESMQEHWDIAGLNRVLKNEFGLTSSIQEKLDNDIQMNVTTLGQAIISELEENYKEKESTVTSEVLRHFEKVVMLQKLDTLWKEHLNNIDQLRRGIGLRGYANKNPKEEYKSESFNLFESMLNLIKYETISILSLVQVRDEKEVDQIESEQRLQEDIQMHKTSNQNIFEQAKSDDLEGLKNSDNTGLSPVAKPQVAKVQTVFNPNKVGRNSPCPCSSGKKYKHCHGKN